MQFALPILRAFLIPASLVFFISCTAPEEKEEMVVDDIRNRETDKTETSKEENSKAEPPANAVDKVTRIQRYGEQLALIRCGDKMTPCIVVKEDVKKRIWAVGFSEKERTGKTFDYRDESGSYGTTATRAEFSPYPGISSFNYNQMDELIAEPLKLSEVGEGVIDARIVWAKAQLTNQAKPSTQTSSTLATPASKPSERQSPQTYEELKKERESLKKELAIQIEKRDFTQVQRLQTKLQMLQFSMTKAAAFSGQGAHRNLPGRSIPASSQQPASNQWIKTKVAFEDARVRVTISPDGAASLNNIEEIRNRDVRYAALATDAGQIFGLVDLGEPDSKPVVALASELVKLSRTSDNMEPKIRLRISNSDFEYQHISLETIVTARPAIDIKYFDVKVAPLSETKIDSSSGKPVLTNLTEESKLSRHSLEPAEGGKLEANVPLNITGRQGSMRFRGQISGKNAFGDEIETFAPFEFRVARYRDKPTELILPPESGASLFEGKNEVPGRSEFSTTGTILSVSRVKMGKVLCFHTSESLLQFFDPGLEEWLEPRIPIEEGAIATGSATGVFVYYPELSVIEKWNAETGEKVFARILKVKGSVLGISASPMDPDAALMILTNQQCLFVSPETLRPYSLEAKKGPKGRVYEKDLNDIAGKLKEVGEIPFITASNTGNGFLASPIDRKPNSNDSSVLWFSPKPEAGIFQIDEVSGTIIGHAASTWYTDEKVEGITSRSTRIKNAGAIYLDPAKPGLFAALEKQTYTYIPAAPRRIDLCIKNGLGRNSSLVKLTGLDFVRELSGDSKHAASYIWNRGHLFLEEEKFLAIRPDMTGFALYDCFYKEALKKQVPLLGDPLSVISEGDEWKCQLSSVKGATYNLLESPEGATLKPNGLLEWTAKSLPESNGGQLFSVEAVTEIGDSIVGEFEVRIEKTLISSISKTDDNGLSIGEKIPLPTPLIRKLNGVPLQIFSGGAGKYLCVVYSNKPTIDVFDIANASLYCTIETIEGTVFGVANSEFLFLCQPSGRMVERIRFKDPTDRKTAVFPQKIVALGAGAYSQSNSLVILEKFESEVRASDSTQIGGHVFTRQVIDDGGCLLSILDSEDLSSEMGSYSPEIASAVNQMMRSGWDEFRLLPADSEGKHFLLSMGLLTLKEGGFNLKEIPNMLINSERDRVHVGPGAEYFTMALSTRTKYEQSRKIETLVPVPRMNLNIARSRTAGELLFFTPSLEDPVLIVNSLPELLEEEPSYDDRNQRFTTDQESFYIPESHSLITVSKSQKQLYFRNLDLKEIGAQLNVPIN